MAPARSRIRLPSGTSTCTSVGTRVVCHQRKESTTAAAIATANATTTTASRVLRMRSIPAPPSVAQQVQVNLVRGKHPSR